MSRAGRNYRAAHGSPTWHLGQTTAHIQDAGRACGIPFQVAEVERPLTSVSRVAAADSRVSSPEDTGEISRAASGSALV